MNNKPIDAICAKCEYPNCDNKRKCFHYCSKHHKLFCIKATIACPRSFAVQVGPTTGLMMLLLALCLNQQGKGHYEQ